MATDTFLSRHLEGYPLVHASRANLVLHVLTVPLFQLGTLAPLIALLTGAPWPALGALALPLAMAAQARGHALEARSPEPFTGPLNVVGRIFAEQWITFPRFVLSGGLARAWRRDEVTPVAR